MPTTLPPHSPFYRFSTSIETRCFINNTFVETADKFPIYNPSTEELSAQVSQAGVNEVDAAVDAAEKAFPAWSELSADARGACLRRLAELMVESVDELAYLEAISMGKVTAYYPGEVRWAAALLQYFAGLATELHGETSLSTAGMLNLTLRQPYGVCGAIIPWNGPLAAFAMKVGPALAAGNTLVLKPSEKSPLTALCVAKLIPKAGFPPGVLSILPGFGTVTGAAIASHMRIRKLAFTGSTRTGRIVKQLAAKSNLKHVTLELGGKSPCIVFEDADLAAAAEAAALSIAGNSGQLCYASSRVYVQASIADRFVEAYTAAFRKAMGKVGDALDPDTTHAPQADAAQFRSVMGFIEAARTQGLEPIAGGRRVGERGYFIEPTVFLDPGEGSQINREEIFGPVAVVNTFETEEEALQRANDTEYGLYSSIFTNDLKRVLRFAKGLEAGMVGVNCTSPTAPFDMPFGGFKQSGEGREFSFKSLDSWTETKTVMMKM